MIESYQYNLVLGRTVIINSYTNTHYRLIRSTFIVKSSIFTFEKKLNIND